jgi:cold shock CspA family protein
VFVHFSDVEGEARILIENELVQFRISQTQKGLRARTVSRITDRLTGVVLRFEKGFGYIRSHRSKQLYFVHYTDLIGNGFRRLEPDYEVEFSPFESERGLQAKEVVITDSRPKLERFARLEDASGLLAALAQLAQPEPWAWKDSQPGNFPILDNYLHYTFRRIQEEDKVVFASASDGKRYASFNTGLVSEREEEIFALFEPYRRRVHPASYVSPPAWSLRGFVTESDYRMASFAQRPELACYYQDPGDLVYDPSRRLVADYEHLVGDREERFPELLRHWGPSTLTQRLRQAIELTERRVRRNFRLAVPQYYEGSIQLLLPLCMEQPDHADLALVVAREQELYRVQTAIPLNWAYQNARLLGPPGADWLRLRQEI